MGVLLSITMILALLPGSISKAEGKWEIDVTSEFTVQNDDGEYLYKVQVSEDKLSFQLDMTNINTNETTTMVYHEGIGTTYKTISEDTKGNNRTTNSELVSVVDFNPSIKMAESSYSVMGYRDVTACIIPTLAGNYLWYQMGISGADVGYMLMGCDWTYRVQADACDDCSNFRNKIIESNQQFSLAGLSPAAGIVVAIAVLAAGPTGGLSVAMAWGLYGVGAAAMVAACAAEMSAHDSYDIAKGYGVRVY